MAQIAIPPQHNTFAHETDSPMGSPLFDGTNAQQYRPVELLPNPDFVFPARPSPGSFASRRPMSANMASSRLTPSLGSAQRQSVSALPDFTFNPSGSSMPKLSPVTPVTPLLSPTEPSVSTPSRIGHRRGGSEFIGGDGKTGVIGLMSTSPKKGDGVLPAPAPSARLGPPKGRRGHAHRRSGALSCHDLQSIINPSTVASAAQLRADSAPVTPAEHTNKPFFADDVTRPRSPASEPSGSSGAGDQDSAQSSPRAPAPRARVGFADRVEYIRPLSTISSETEASISTIRGHSVTNSLSSLASASSPPSARKSRLKSTSAESLNEKKRPSTAGGVLDKKSFFRMDQTRHKPSSPPVRILHSSASEPSLISSPLASPTTSLPSPAATSDDDQKVKRSKKVRLAWASHLFQHKPKSSHKSKSPTQSSSVGSSPAEVLNNNVSYFDLDTNFDINNTVTIVSQAASEQPTPEHGLSRRMSQPDMIDSESLSPAIDLDAALGPFSSLSGANRRGNQARSFNSARRSMHSSNFNVGPFGQNQVHRRTESAPELAPFEMRQSAMVQTSTMADVFEEEEEEDREEDDNSSSTESTDSGEDESSRPSFEDEPRIQVVDAEDQQKQMSWKFEDGLRIRKTSSGLSPSSSDLQSPITPPAMDSDSNPTLNIIADSPDLNEIEIVEAFEEPRSSSVTKDSDSTITPTGTIDEGKQLPPMMSLTLPQPQYSMMTPDTFSSYSTPEFSPYNTTFDTPRLGTASSMTTTDNRTISSTYFVEPGPEFRASVDDVPSLTSSRSTMTNAPRQMFSPLGPRSIGDRSESNASTHSLHEQRRKRSSIASFSKLVSGSFGGERSKLSIEQRPHSQHAHSVMSLKVGKSKKPSRLSKLMHFWKTKERD